MVNICDKRGGSINVSSEEPVTITSPPLQSNLSLVLMTKIPQLEIYSFDFRLYSLITVTLVLAVYS